jgi:hypothetical protein
MIIRAEILDFHHMFDQKINQTLGNTIEFKKFFA